jgi:hypothetical protein
MARKVHTLTYGQIVLSTEGGQPVCAALHAAQLSAMVCLRVRRSILPCAWCW